MIFAKFLEISLEMTSYSKAETFLFFFAYDF